MTNTAAPGFRSGVFLRVALAGPMLALSTAQLRQTDRWNGARTLTLLPDGSENGNLPELRPMTALTDLAIRRGDYRVGGITRLCFPLLPQLTTLRAHENGLRELDVCRVSGLKELFLRDNELTSLASICIGLPELRMLDVSKNRLQHLETDALALCSRLHSLNLSENTIFDWIPADVSRLTSLRNLCLVCTGTARVPDNLSSLTSLVSLDLSRNCIWQIPLWLANLTRLMMLNLQHNYIESLRESYVRKTNLRISLRPRRSLWVHPRHTETGQLILALRHNPLTPPPAFRSCESHGLPRLLEIAARLVILYASEHGCASRGGIPQQKINFVQSC